MKPAAGAARVEGELAAARGGEEEQPADDAQVLEEVVADVVVVPEARPEVVDREVERGEQQRE